MGPLYHISSADAFNKLIASEKPTVVDFWATWCGPCRVIGPIFEKLSNEFGDRVNFAKVDVDEQRDIASTLKITAMPTFIVFKDGNFQEQFLGADPRKLRQLVERYAAGSSSDASAPTPETKEVTQTQPNVPVVVEGGVRGNAAVA